MSQATILGLINPESRDSELRARLAARCYKNPKLYQSLAEWLGVYNYIIPAHRQLISCSGTSSDPAFFFNLWEWMRVVECSLDLNEQRLSWKLILESEH